MRPPDPYLEGIIIFEKPVPCPMFSIMMWNNYRNRNKSMVDIDIINTYNAAVGYETIDRRNKNVPEIKSPPENSGYSVFRKIFLGI